MYDHIGLRVQDVEKSVRFYEAALKSLGHVVNSRDANGAGYRTEGRIGALAALSARRKAPALTSPSARRTAARSTIFMPKG